MRRAVLEDHLQLAGGMRPVAAVTTRVRGQRDGRREDGVQARKDGGDQSQGQTTAVDPSPPTLHREKGAILQRAAYPHHQVEVELSWGGLDLDVLSEASPAPSE